MDVLKINKDKYCFGAKSLLKNFDQIRSNKGILCQRKLSDNLKMDFGRFTQVGSVWAFARFSSCSWWWLHFITLYSTVCMLERLSMFITPTKEDGK